MEDPGSPGKFDVIRLPNKVTKTVKELGNH